MKHILLSTFSKDFDASFETYLKENPQEQLTIDYNLSAYEKEELEDSIDNFDPDVLVYAIETTKEVSEARKQLLRVHNRFPTLQILLLMPVVDRATTKLELKVVDEIINHGIYPAFIRSLNIKNVIDLIRSAPTLEQVSFIDDLLGKNRRSNVLKVDTSNYSEERVKSSIGVNNIIAVHSSKPGSGKSTFSTNLALALALYSNNSDGQKLKVGLIDGDSQNYSVGVMLAIQDNLRYNLLIALEHAKTSQSEAYFNKSFISYDEVPNLYTLTVPNQYYTKKDFKDSAENYEILLKWASKHFDVVVVDTNSRYDRHSEPLLKMASRVLEIVTLDPNNIANTLRGAETLRNNHIMSRTQYVLNQASISEYENYLGDKHRVKSLVSEEDITDYDIRINYRIPEICRTILLNSMKTGIPLMLSKENAAILPQLYFLKFIKDNYTIDEEKFRQIQEKWNEILDGDEASQDDTKLTD